MQCFANAFIFDGSGRGIDLDRIDPVPVNPDAWRGAIQYQQFTIIELRYCKNLQCKRSSHIYLVIQLF